MAVPGTTKGGKFKILLSDGGSPETFTAPCGFSQRSFTFTKALNEVSLADCDDPDAMIWLGRDATSLSIAVQGQGVLATEAVDTWLTAWESVDSTNAKIEWDLASGTVTWTGALHIETFEVQANNGERATVTVSLQSDGEMVRTSGS